MVDVVASPSRVAQTSYVEWSAIIAGAVVASAISFVLLTAGTSIGLSLVSPHPPASYGKLAGSFAAFWLIAVPIFSLLIGGYIAGRMRASLDGATPDEVEFSGMAFKDCWSGASVSSSGVRSRSSPRRVRRSSAAMWLGRPFLIDRP